MEMMDRKLQHESELQQKKNLDIGNNGGNGNSNNSGGSSSYHPDDMDIAEFVLYTKDDIINNAEKVHKMIMHFLRCSECRYKKEKMMELNEKFEYALSVLRNNSQND